jgi:hypothetical protein
VVGFDGNDHVQEDDQLAIATVVPASNGNDNVQLGNGNNTVRAGNGMGPGRRDQGVKLMGRERDFSHIPILDVSAPVAGGPCSPAVAKCIGAACRESGFFHVVGQGVDAALQTRNPAR